MHVSEFKLGELVFEWDPRKYTANIAKHGITFEEAATTWLDPSAIERPDDRHADREQRWIRIGAALRGCVLVVWSTDRDTSGCTRIRLIGARRASRGERRLYERQA